MGAIHARPITRLNPTLAFAGSSRYFVLTELGRNHSSDGTGTVETSEAGFDVTVDLAALKSRQNPILGLFDPTGSADGVTGIKIEVTADA